MIVLIDNYDSFTFNLFHYLGGLGADVAVYRNDKITAERVMTMDPDAIVLSPGPCTPNDPASDGRVKATGVHSLVVERTSLPEELAVTAETDDRLIMGLAHRTLAVHGVQFHPESIASEHGNLILRNFLDIATAWNASTGRRAADLRATRRVP